MVILPFPFKKRIVVIFFFITVISITLYYFDYNDKYIYNTIAEHKLRKTIIEDTFCHFDYQKDDLPSAENPRFVPQHNSIFFHEISCSGGLTTRQACAVESAARAHPDRHIYVLFSAPVKLQSSKNIVDSISPIKNLEVFSNIHFARVHLLEYTKGTPLEYFLSHKELYKSKWWVEHTSDILKYLTLYKWGGVYLDTDMLVVKSFTSLGNNWVGLQDNRFVNSAAISVSTDSLGRAFIESLITEIATNYKPFYWSYNGPDAITRVLRRLCKTKQLSEWSSETCQGFTVLQQEYFYPIHYSNTQFLFDPSKKYTLKKNTHGVHLWNYITQNETIKDGALFLKLVWKHCPLTFERFYGDFIT